MSNHKLSRAFSSCSLCKINVFCADVHLKALLLTAVESSAVDFVFGHFSFYLKKKKKKSQPCPFGLCSVALKSIYLTGRPRKRKKALTSISRENVKSVY